MAQMNMVQAINDALRVEMRRDPKVVVLGEDVGKVGGLLLASIRDPDPVMFFEPKRIYRAARADVPEGDYTVNLGEAKVIRPGSQVTVIAWGAMLYEAIEAANQAAGHGIDCEVLDLRT